MPVIFLTDALIFLLIAMIVGFVFYARRYPHLRMPWSRVLRSRMAMVALVVLSVYSLIAVLDSLHYRPRLTTENADGGTQYSAEVLSVFDWLVTSLREREEKTYSAPFATHLYAKETVEVGGGAQRREFPRLRYGGSHLSDPATERGRDIFLTGLRGAAGGVALWMLLCIAFIGRGAIRASRSFSAELRHIVRRDTTVPWIAILIAVGVIIVVTMVAAKLGVKYHILGTDKVGKDVLYQALKSIRTGLVIGTVTTLVMLPFAIVLGLMAGYFRGWVDDVIQYVYTTLNSIPSVLLIAAAILMLHIYMANHADDFVSLSQRADLRLLFLCLILGVTSWTGLCRYLRGETLKIREVEYIQAATAFGVSHSRILFRHVLPNVMHIVTITVVLDFSGLVLAEAVLSYVNIGVDPTMDSWGNMINSARLEMAREPVVWWSLTAALIFMFTLVLCANLFSDAVRDAFDPRLRK
ncbi:MAG: ABC transporter permease [Gammaproteobacteria bacterium]|nr:ABC transporter permease [Gammaproteobacteria bacterium]